MSFRVGELIGRVKFLEMVKYQKRCIERLVEKDAASVDTPIMTLIGALKPCDFVDTNDVLMLKFKTSIHLCMLV